MMVMKSLEFYLAEYAMKEVTWLGKEAGGRLVARNLILWERVYGSDIASKARKLITAEWRSRYPARAGRTKGPVIGDVGGNREAEGEPTQEVHS